MKTFRVAAKQREQRALLRAQQSATRDGWLIGWGTTALLFALALIAGIIIGPYIWQ